MPATDCHYIPSSSSSASSAMNRRRDQAVTAQETELEAFQRQVAARFRGLAAAESDELLSIPWVLTLLDSFLCCHEEFRAIVFNQEKGCWNKPPLDRQISDYFDRSVKALDVCNAVRDGIERVRQWKIQLEIVLCAFGNQKSTGEGQIRRAKKALADLAVGMLDGKQADTSSARRNRSFGRSSAHREEKSLTHFRSLSWSVSSSWSAARQLQAIGSNLVAPRPNEIVSTNGLNVAVFTMNYLLLFVMWALVAAIPCQDRGLQTHFPVTRQFLWAGPVAGLHERILESSKRQDRRNSCGLLKEIQAIEKCARRINETMDIVHFPLTEEEESKLRQRVEELGVVCGTVKNGLDPLERQVREVFRRIVRSRMDGLDTIGPVAAS